MTPSYTKLKDGNWGVRAPANVKEGAKVSVATKSGKVKVETIARVLWRGADKQTGEQVAVCSVAPREEGSDHSEHYDHSTSAPSSSGGSQFLCPHCSGPLEIRKAP